MSVFVWSAASAGNWSTGANWKVSGTTQASPPTANDDVQIGTGTGATQSNLTITANAVCRSIDVTGYTGTLTHQAFTLTIGTSTANGTNKALLFPASGWTYTLGDPTFSAIAFISTVASTTQTVDFGGQTTGPVTFNAAPTSGYQLVNHGFSNGSSAAVSLVQGTLDTNGQTCSWWKFSSTNSNVRTLTFGASSITINANTTPWDTTTTTNMTLNPGTSTLTFASNTSNSTATMIAGNLIYGNVVFAMTNNNQVGVLSGSNPTFANLTFTGSPTSGAIYSLDTDITVTNSLTMNGSNGNTSRLLINSNTLGTAHTITNNGSGTFSNVDLQDVTGAGTASWNLSAITGNSGDCGGNSGITFTTARNLFWVGSNSNWSTANKWSLTSGGTANQSNPLAQDNLTFDTHSFSANGQTLTANMPRLGKNIDFSGLTTNIPILATNTASVQRIFGSLTLKAGMTQTGANFFYFDGRGSNTLTPAGVTFTNGVRFQGPGGTLTLTGDLNCTSNISLIAGTLTATTNNVTAAVFNLTGAITRTLNMGTGTWTCSGTGFVWNPNTGNLTINPGTSTIVVSDTSATSKTFSGFNLSYNNLTITGDNVTISGNNSFTTLNINNASLPTGLLLNSNNTQTITSNLTTNSSAGHLAILKATTGGTTAYLSKTTGTIALDYMSIQDSHAIGGANWYAGPLAHSTNVSNNTGWIFSAAPVWSGGWGIPIQ